VLAPDWKRRPAEPIDPLTAATPAESLPNVPNSRRIPSRTAAHRRRQDPGRPTGLRAGGLQVLRPDEPGFCGGDDWMGDARAASAELAQRLLALLGVTGRG
jgi:hypothetical protein